MDRQTIINRINKLMELAGNNPSEHEAASAAEKAQAMLAEYNLSMADLKATDKPMSDMFINEDYTTSGHPWRFGLGMAVAQLYFCAYYIRTRQQFGYDNPERTKHCFAGAQHNVAVAKLIFAYLVETIERLAQAGAKSVPKKEQSPYRVTFRTQASYTLQDRLIKRKRAAEKGDIQAVNETGEGTGKNLPALLSTYTQEKERVDEFLKETFGEMKKKKTSGKTTFHSKGLVDGREAGKSIGLDPQVGKSEQRRISNDF